MTLSHDLARARRATAVTFALVGATSAVWVVRIPALRDKLGLSEAQVGIEVLAWGLGALAAMQVSTRLMPRFGSHRVLGYSVPASVASLMLLAFAPSFPFLVAGGLVFGSLFGLVDVAANAQASELERACGRPLMGKMHAGWSLGAVLGGAFGAATAAAGLGFTPSVAMAAALAVPIALVVAPRFHASAPAVQDTEGKGASKRLPWVVHLLGALMFCAFLAEGSVADWSSLHLHDTLQVSEAVAALGYPVFELAMLLGRLFCDRVTERFGGRLLLGAAGLLAAAGFAVLTFTDRVFVAFAGLALVGAAVCVVVPLTFSLAGVAGGKRNAQAVARAGMYGYSGLLLGPVAIGFIAEHHSLRISFAVVVVTCLLISIGAVRLPDIRIPDKTTGEDGERPSGETDAPPANADRSPGGGDGATAAVASTGAAASAPTDGGRST
ncbi:MFS transporter [Streptomyces vinaceus]|uniref:MFS transporter n=1 Tax=Streptomyces vinaceus TaxID=1960 RepID=UPI003808A9F3